MIQILLAAGIALAVSIMLTPILIKAFSKQGFGQEIRTEGPASHQAKRGTPTMGGVAILTGIWAAISAHTSSVSAWTTRRGHRRPAYSFSV
ncbi:hypothetical protein GCM10020255_088310 [Rhodococcus baikonurensis]